jgi:hypothetical protein
MRIVESVFYSWSSTLQLGRLDGLMKRNFLTRISNKTENIIISEIKEIQIVLIIGVNALYNLPHIIGSRRD